MIHNVKIICVLFIISVFSFVSLPSVVHGISSTLTLEERAWLEQHDGKIVVNNESGWPPIIDTDKDGNPFGIVIDYQKLIEKKLNFKFKMDKPDNWTNFMTRFKKGEIDVNNNLQKTAERSEYALFTKPYIEIPNVIIVRKKIKGSLTLEKMRGMKIAITQNFAIHNYIKTNFDYLQLIPFENDLTCLLEAATKSVDAAVVNLAVASFIIEKNGIANLRVAGDTGYANSLCFASRKDLPVLNRILEKGLDLITQAERDAIYKKWISLGYTPFYKNQNFWIVSCSAAGVILIFIILIIRWNQSLKKQVQLRTEKLESVNLQLKDKIAEQKQIEENLRASEMQFKQVFEHVGIGIAIYQAAENGNDFIFKDINPAGAKIGKKPRIEHIGKSVLEVYPGVKELGLFAVFQEVLRSGMTKHHPITQYQDEKLAFWTDNYVSKLPSGEIMAVYEDVTVNKKAEETLKNINLVLETRVAQRTADLEEINKELEDFVYSISHDLRAPLRSISGFSEIIDRRHKGSLNEEGQHYFNNIIKASKQMGELIDDLLKFSRLGRLSIKSEKVLLNDVFKTAMETLSGEIEKTGAQVNIADQLPAVQGDLTLTTNIFMNLIGNALKYHKPDIPPVIDINFEIQTPHVIISVIDNGIGIDPVYHEKIFKIFQRLHSQSDYPGTGIGLAAVKKAVQIMKGQVWVESKPGKGSIFTIKFSKAAK